MIPSSGEPIAFTQIQAEFWPNGGAPNNLGEIVANVLRRAVGEPAHMAEFAGLSNPHGVLALSTNVSGTYVIPAAPGALGADLILVGGGGGAGGTAAGVSTGGGGGTGGFQSNDGGASVAVRRDVFPAPPAPVTVTVVCGAAGINAVVGTGSGIDGAPSSLQRSGMSAEEADSWRCSGGKGAAFATGGAGGTPFGKPGLNGGGVPVGPVKLPNPYQDYGAGGGSSQAFPMLPEPTSGLAQLWWVRNV